jgi:hypothetical protein
LTDHHDAIGPASPDHEYLETPPGSTYEHTDASVWIIVKFLFWLAVSAVIIHVGLGLLYALLIERAEETGEPRYPLAATQGERLPPAPRLQQFPHNDLYQFRQGEEAFLHGYGWMNKETGIVHIPIEDAMRLTVERELLPSRTPADRQPVETPGMMPSDASAGRLMERRRQ